MNCFACVGHYSKITPLLNSRTEPLQMSSSAQENAEQNDTKKAKNGFKQSDRSSSVGMSQTQIRKTVNRKNAKENSPKRVRITFRKFAVRYVNAPILPFHGRFRGSINY